MTQAPAIPATRAAPALASSELPRAVRRIRLAYLTTEYPKVSHTFIRREIQELERRGHQVLRLAIRQSGAAIADALDRAEAARTVHCLALPKWRFVTATGWCLMTRPARWLRAIGAALAMSRVSERGLVRHLAYLAEAAVLLRILRRERIEHLHVHFGTNAAAVALLIRRLGGPTYSMTVHGPDEFDAPRGFSLGRKIAEAAFVAAISDFCAAQLRRWVGFEHWSKIHIVHCSVGDDFFDDEREIDSASRTLLSIGRLSAQKGQLLLVEAMRVLIDEGHDVKLVLAGDGEMRPQIERLIAECGLQAHIEITGWVDEATVRRHLRAARALVQPSFAEGLPVVMMEALAMGRPVIATTIAGVPELVRDGENGWLVLAGNLEALVEAMREALEAPVHRLNAMGRAGRELARQRHRTATEVERLEALLLEHVACEGGA